MRGGIVNTGNSRLTVASLIAAACVALALWWALRPPPMERVAEPNLLYEKFEEAVFETDTGVLKEKFRRWNSDVRIFVDPNYFDFFRVPLTGYLRRIDRLTGLISSIADEPADANIVFYFSPTDRFEERVRAFDFYLWVTFRTLPTPNCFFGKAVAGKTERALIGINSEQPDFRIQHCLLEELYQGIGPGKNTSIIRPSISSNDEHLTELSLNDKILLRAMYDPAIKPGMAREEVLRRIRPILERLTAAVKRDGAQALDHPAWVARQRTTRNPP